QSGQALPSKASRAHRTTNRGCVYPGGDALSALKLCENLVRERVVEVICNPALALQKPQCVDPLLLRVKACQPRCRFSVPCDHDVRPGRGQIDQLRKLGLGLVDI